MSNSNITNRKTTTLRASGNLLQSLSVEAKKNQRSINSEMVFRLENSLKREQAAA
ncbi:MAG: hypothetical protein COA83_09775 [Methylophaga sp.]|nr:MAG: hypothetical protein COA83_09775 [Methylophaga sp.]